MVDIAKYPLPDGVDDVVLNREMLADALQVSPPTIDTYRKSGMPVITEGSNGRSYEFQLSACFAWISERKDIERSEDEQRKAAVRQMSLALLGKDESDPHAGLTEKQKKDLFAAEREYMALARERGEMMMRSSVVNMMIEVLQVYRDGLGILPDRLARECGLKPDQVEKAAAACDAMLQESADKVEKSLGAKLNARSGDPKLPS
ncbi:terminase small subunit [Cohaesibacter celericrescens]|uniref:Terminase small subunit n=1 Tax=Cohaesibacter celericrescens TaxID=2067669 RepID=A0A2N5XX49_9HYPH|nr:terminase small subunit [Cohaesibacter celericrescens]PLW79080.1 hypothetical protein C0081_02280 [Cohaesibacter celericrescens]